ncbi:MAG: MFS transporter, partial [Propionibacteriaceae bacterium]|nr:MFS transporter [Propionibacteriaceae bacterium]
MARILADITPLRVSPEFRRLWWGQGLAAIGGQFTAMAVSLEIHDLTNSTLAVGLLGAFALVPLILLGLYGGALVDRHDRRTVALIASVIMWCSTIGIALQAWLHVGSIWVLYGLIAVQSGASAVNQPARSAIIPRLVEPRLMPAANALNSSTWTIAQMGGPLVGAATVAAFGYQWAYTIDAITFTAALYALFRLPSIRPQTVETAPGDARVGGFRSIVDGFRYLATRPNVRMTFLVDLAAMVLANPQALFPAIATDVIGGGDTTAGWLTAFVAIGSTLAMVLSGPLGRVRRQGLVVVVMVVGWGASIAGFGLVLVLAGTNHPTHVVGWAMAGAAVCLILAGAFDSVSSIFRNTILQVATPDDMRGRLQGVFTVVVNGGPNLGRVVSGGGARALRPVLPVPLGATALIGGLLCVATVGLLHKTAPHFAQYDAEHPQP